MKQTKIGRIGLRTGLALVASGAMVVALAPAAFAAPSTVSQATAQVLSIAALDHALDIQLSDPPTSASSDGTANDGPNTANPSPGTPLLDGALSLGALSETAAASRSGASYACAGVVAPGGTIQVGEHGLTCTPDGAGSGGLSLDLGKIPGVGGLLSAIADVTITADAVIAHAVDNGSTSVGDAGIVGLKVHVSLLGGLLGTWDVPVSLTGDPNENVLQAVIDALTGQNDGALHDLIGILTDSLAPLVSIETNVQDRNGNALSVTALEVSVLKSANTADVKLASVTVGPNTATHECAPGPFPDVHANSTFCVPTTWMKVRHYALGFTDGLYRPTIPQTRSQLAGFLYRQDHDGQDGGVCTGTERPFPDVALDNPFCADIAWFREQHITQGFTDGTFRPGTGVTREGMAAFLYRYHHDGDDAGVCVGPAKPFPDVAVESQFCGDIAWFKDQHVTVGDETGNFQPVGTVLRQTMAAFIYRLAHPDWLSGWEP